MPTILVSLLVLLVVGFGSAYVLEEKGVQVFVRACVVVTLAVGIVIFFIAGQDLSVAERLTVASLLSSGCGCTLFVPIYIAERKKPPHPFIGIVTGSVLTVLFLFVAFFILFAMLWEPVV